MEKVVRVRAVRDGLPLGGIFLAIAIASCAAIGLLHLDHLPWRVCVFKTVTGWPCLACGSTRALGRLFALDLAGAFAMNPLAALGALALVPWGVADALLMTRGRALSLELAPPVSHVARAGAVALLLVNWVYLLAVGR